MPALVAEAIVAWPQNGTSAQRAEVPDVDGTGCGPGHEERRLRVPDLGCDALHVGRVGPGGVEDHACGVAAV